MIVIILGPDSGLAHRTLKRVLIDRDPSGQSTSWLDGDSVGIAAVIGDISSVGFFSAGRVVIVENLITRLGKQGSRDAGAAPNWSGLFAAVPEASTLVLVDASLRDIPSLAKKALPTTAKIEFSKPPRGAVLIDWIVRTVSEAGGKIDKTAAQDLAMTLYPEGWRAESRNPLYDRPPDMELLENEIRKLVLAAHPDPVTSETIQMMTLREEQDRIFEFLNAAANGNIAVAMQELEKLLAVGEDPAKLLAQLAGNIEIASVVAAGGRRPANAIASDIEMKSLGRVQATQRGLHGMSPNVALARSRIAAEADRKFKTGQLKDPLAALYDTILRIAHMRHLVAHQR